MLQNQKLNKKENTTPPLAVVLLSYNSKELLQQFLPSILKSIPEGSSFYLVNNASTDGTKEYIEQNFPAINLISFEENKGFTGGFNEALDNIEARYYCLLSSDVEITPNWIEPIIELMQSDEQIAICQPKIKFYKEKESFEYAGASGGFIDYLGYPFCRGRIFQALEKDEGQYNSNKEIFWASGACFFIKSEVFHSLGGFDKDYFAHMEEIDLCWRAKNMGFKVMVCPKSAVFHVGGYIIQYESPAKIYYNFRNNLILLTKNLPKGKVFPIILLRLALDGVASFQYLLKGNFKGAGAVLKAHFHYHTKIGRWRKKRKVALKQVKNRNTKGIYAKSIVWQYYIKKVKIFNDLPNKP